MLTEGEPLDKGRRFRLRGYTGVVLVVFLLGHVSAYQTYLHISDCEAFPVSGISANAVRIVLFAVIGLLYFVGWVEVVRMVQARWWPHWGTLASKADPAEAAQTAFPSHLWILVLLAAGSYLVASGCTAFKFGQEPSSGWHVGVWTSLLGSFAGSYGAWFIRVLEPFGPTSTS